MYFSAMSYSTSQAMPGYYFYDIHTKYAKYFSTVPGPEQATLSLITSWLLGYCILIAGAHVQVFTTAIFAALTSYMVCILYTLFVSLLPRSKRHPKRKRSPVDSLLRALENASKKSKIQPHGEYDFDADLYTQRPFPSDVQRDNDLFTSINTIMMYNLLGFVFIFYLQMFGVFVLNPTKLTYPVFRVITYLGMFIGWEYWLWIILAHCIAMYLGWLYYKLFPKNQPHALEDLDEISVSDGEPPVEVDVNIFDEPDDDFEPLPLDAPQDNAFFDNVQIQLGRILHFQAFYHVASMIPSAAKNMSLSRLFKNVKNSVPFFAPHAKEEMDYKAASRVSHSTHSKGRCNRKEQRKRVKLASKRILEDVRKKEEQAKKMKFVPHGMSENFMEFAGNLGRFVQSFEGDQADEIIRHAENVLLLAYDLQRADSFHSILVAVIHYMKQYTAKSITGTLMTMLTAIMEDDDDDSTSSDEVKVFLDDTGAFELTPHALTGRDILDGWELMKTNTIHKKISYLLCAAMSCSICSVKSIDWSIGGVQLIKAEALKETSSAVDLLDAVIHTFTWISESGWCCIQEKSLAPLLYSDQRIRKYYEDCSEVIAYADSAKAGNVEDLQEYIRKLDDVLKTTSKMQSLASKAMKEVLQKKYATLVNIKQDMVAKGKNTQYRFAPLGVSISGESSIGKSNLGELTMKHALNAMGFNDSKDGIITLNEADKHDNTYTTDVVGVHIDDAANVKADFVDQAPSRKYLTMFNNVAAQAVKAELNEKGCVFINFKCGVITTNVKDLDARVYSNYPIAVLRRFMHVSARVKQKYCRPGATSLNTDHPDLVNEADPYKIHDVWEFDIEEAIPGKLGYHKLTAEFEGRQVLCENLGLRDYLLALTYFGKKHAKKQRKEVERNRCLEKSKCCSECNMLPQFCRCIHSKAEQMLMVYKDEGCPPVAGALVSEESGCRGEGYCNECNAYHAPEEHALTDQLISMAISDIVKGFTKRLMGVICPPFVEILYRGAAQTIPVRELRKRVDTYMARSTPYIIKWIPDYFYQTEFCQKVIMKEHRSLECVHMLKLQEFIVKSAVWTVYPAFWLAGVYGVAFHIMISYCVYIFCEMQMNHEFARYRLALTTHREALTDYGRSMRDTWRGPSLLVGLSMATVGMVLIAWNLSRKKSKKPESQTYNESDLKAAYEQGWFCRQDDKPFNTNGLAEKIEEHDNAPGWFGFMMNKLHLDMKNTTVPVGATPPQVINSLSSNLAWGQFKAEEFSAPLSCGVFFPRKSVMLFPKHMLYPSTDMTKPIAKKVEVTVTRHQKSGGKFNVTINPKLCYDFPDMDLMGCYVPNCPDLPTRTQWLPDVLPKGSCLGHMLVPNRDGDKEIGAVTPRFGNVSHSYCSMYGATYSTPFARKGACMSPIVNEGKNPCIVGFHIGGDSNHKIGICQTVIKSDMTSCIEWLEENAGFLSAEAGPMPKRQMGYDVMSSPNINSKAKYMTSLDNSAFIDLHGSTKLRSEQKSRVVPSLLSESIRDICGIPQRWGPPRLRPNWAAYNVNVGQFSDPSDMFDPVLLKRARDDWAAPLLEAMDEYIKVEDFRPLNMKETILGIPGKKYIDALPMDTGIGFPIFGKKNKIGADGEPLHFTEIRDGEILIDRIPKQHVLDEFDRLIECWKNNQRGYPVTSATLKDEPTLLTKEKVRVFQAAPVALSLAIRMYFLPIARFLHLHPLLAESAVGVNSFSKDWKVLTDHMHKFAGENKERLLGWDYSKYDVRMNSQLVRSAWESFIHLAERGGYPSESLNIMKAMIVDIAHPLMDLNGTLLTAYNMNTSGNNMTVDVNGTVGSFLVRMGFFTLFPEKENFRNYVALMTYGDDAGGSVTEEAKAFEFVFFKRFLEQHGMKLTLPSKTDEERSFLTLEESDFIKRIGNYIPEIGTEIGRLDEASIWKSLHSNLKTSRATPPEVAVSCIETALHEWFAFGREHYEMRRQQMQEVAHRNNLDFPALNHTFDDRVAFWIEKYEDTDPLLKD